MAYVEKYVSPTGGGLHDGTTPSNAWTFTEMLSNQVAGERANILNASYSISGGTLSNAGTYNNRLVCRGYNSTIGDLDGLQRNPNGSLNVDNFPTITTASTIIQSSFSIFQNVYMTGSVNGLIFGDSNPDSTFLISSKVENTYSGTGARCCEGDSSSSFLNNDLVCTQLSHGVILSSDNHAVVAACRIVGNSDTATFCTIRNGIVTQNAFINTGTPGSSIGLNFEQITYIIFGSNNTFYNFGTDVKTPNVAGTSYPIVLINNHPTDSGKWIDNPYSATADHFVVEMNSRTRDITTLRTGFGDSLNIGEVTTDTGGAETDYVDAPNGDITLISTAAGINAGLGI